jgi:predicted secreted protein
MGDTPVSGVGAVFNRNAVPVGFVRNITGPDLTRDTIDVTSIDSTGGYREFIGGFRDGGEFTFEMLFTLEGYDPMKDDFESADLQSYTLVLPDSNNTTFAFSGLVTGMSLAVPMDDAIMSNVTIKISGQVTITS